MKKFPARLTFYLLNLLAAILLVCVIGYFVLSHLESYTQQMQKVTRKQDLFRFLPLTI